MWLCVLALAGCEHAFEIYSPPPEKIDPGQYDTIGHTHVPYTAVPRALAEARPPSATPQPAAAPSATVGRPPYLAAARPLLPTREPTAGAPNPCRTRSTECDTRLRALLASLDGQILALQSPPTDLEMQSLRLVVLQLTPLLTPYPDMAAERDELGDLVEKLPTAPPRRQEAIKRRMTEVTDLLRVQLAAAQ